MVKFFKIISWSEGISALLLFFLAMPLKYIFETPFLIRPIGMAHGILFMVYIFLALYLYRLQKWNLKKLFIILAASIIPGATFYIDKKYF